MELFRQESAKRVDRMIQTQSAAIRQAARIFADCLENNGVIQTFGTGHSRAFAMELADRAGGLVPVNKMDLEHLALHANWPLEKVMSPEIERDLEAGKALLSCYQIEPQDTFLISSNSGVNKAVIECAQQIKERGHTLVAVTSLEHTKQVDSRHPSGKKLYELADIVIDNCGPFGDALLTLPGGIQACSTSSITGALIAQMLTAEIIGLLLDKGIVPPVLISNNVPGGIEHDEKLFQQYAGRVQLH
ncbi:SIS domain-containing protein [Ktedonosporobacter rubrisoli]|nr:SIS domain-containing protein [Ktedonosporobacter rubrisoli]